MSRMSISICENDGVPSVITMWRARAASGTRSDSDRRPLAPARSSSAWAPVSANGMHASRTACRRAGSLSMPITLSPRSANDSASGSPTLPRPTIDTSAVVWEAFIPAKRLAATVAQVAQVLSHEADDEAGVIARIAGPQAARLARQAVAPLKARALHPGRRLWHQAGVEIERGADADQQGGRQVRAHAQHPLLLLGLPGSDPHDLRARRVDLGGHRPLLLQAELAEWRGVAAADLQAREARQQAPFQQPQGVPRAPPGQEHRPAGRGGPPASQRHEVG